MFWNLNEDKQQNCNKESHAGKEREREKPTARTIITNIININGHQRQDKTYVKETKLPAEAGRCPWRHAITTSLLPLQVLTDSLVRPFKIAPYNPNMCVNLACHERAGNTKSKAHTHFQAFLKSEHKRNIFQLTLRVQHKSSQQDRDRGHTPFPEASRTNEKSNQ